MAEIQSARTRLIRLMMKDRILNGDGAARLLGVRHDTIYRLVREAAIPGQKAGRQWRFSKTALLAWVRHGVPKEIPSFADVDSPNGASSPDDPSMQERPRRPGIAIGRG